MNEEALLNLIPNCSFVWDGTEWEGLIWLDSRPKPTKEAWETEKARLIAYQPKQKCKDKAKNLISLTDWSVLPDVSILNKSDFIAYREILRSLILNPVEDPIFPVEPNPIWSK